MTTPHAITWFEIPVTDIDRSSRFYGTMLGVTLKPETCPATGHVMAMFPAAVNARSVLAFTYRDVEDRVSERSVWPLGLFFWGKVWTLVAWCELRDDFRHFRVDRIDTVRCLPRTFTPAPGRTLDDYMSMICCGTGGKSA